MDLGGIKLWVFLLGIVSQNAVQGSNLVVNIFTVTSKSAVLRWTSYAGSSSYKLTASPRDTPEPPVFTSFDHNTVMGSLISLSPNTAYTFRVEALDSSMSVLASASVDGSTAPDVPTIKSATSKQSQSMTVDFFAVPGATSYFLRAETSDGSFFLETSVSGSPGTITGLEPYTEYTLSVMSVNSAGRSQPSDWVQAKTVLAAPQLNTSSPSNSSIVVSWAPVPHAVLYSFSVIRNDSHLQSGPNTTDTSMILTDLQPGTNYCIRAYAWSPEYVPGDDVIVCQITRSPTPQAVAVQLVTLNGVTGVSVSWAPSQGAAQYLAVSSTGLNCTSASSPCTLTPVDCGQILSISVTAINQAGPSLPSDPVTFITIPCPPVLVGIEEAEGGNCTASWTPVSYADHYAAFIKRDDGIEQSVNTTGSSCHFNCHCGYSYIINVFAINQAGSSPPGGALNHTTLPCCPESTSVSGVSWETLMMEWTAVRGAVVYETRAAAPNDPAVLCNDTAAVCVLSDLTCNTRYSVVVSPCNELRGCNRSCSPQTHETAPCMPQILDISQTSSSSVNVTWTSPNTAANYTVNAIGSVGGTRSCQSSGTFCVVTDLPCGSSYMVNTIASTSAGLSMPSYSVPFETAPCCPDSLTVSQVTQAMSNVTWSSARGAQSFVASLTSARGDAQCHTVNTQCLMGCITCGTNYTVSLEAISATGHKAECMYQGFSASECCPSGVRLYRRVNNTLRVQWRPLSALSYHTAQLSAGGQNRTCSPALGENSCDVPEVTCGGTYTVLVAPVNPDGTVVRFCSSRMYYVFCSGSDLGMILYRGKRSVD